MTYLVGMDPHERFKDYAKDHCWQAEIRFQNLDSDLAAIGMSPEQAAVLRTSDFEFVYVDDDPRKQEIKEFIAKHEWLGKIPQRPSHWFGAYLDDGLGTKILAGTIIMGNPYQNMTSVTKVLLDGQESKTNIERLIARGASISWAPKNLASWILSKSMTWMVQNTETRLFSCYSDPEARELGTVYQAANFIYLGQSSGTIKQYLDPQNQELGWFSDRDFRKLGKLIKYAKAAGYEAAEINLYKKGYTLDWKAMPAGMEDAIKAKQKEHKDRCQERVVKPKHKYIQILGNGPAETKLLRKRFAKAFPKWAGKVEHRLGLPYPTERGV